MPLRAVDSSNPPDNPLLTAALSYAERGWPVFPCVPGAKNPLTENGLLDASTDTSQIKQWWRQHPGANIGLVTGVASGLVCVDVDVSDGKQGADSLMSVKPTGWETLTSITWSGGWHYLFKHPGDLPVSNRVNALPGIDIRGDGGYIVAPPSRVQGQQYRWHNELTPLELDDSAQSLLQRRDAPATHESPDHAPTALSESQSARVQRALEHIDPKPYDEWVRAGMALYEMTGGSDQGFRLWDEWSSTAENYDQYQMVGKWRSFGSSRGDKITGSTLWKMATEGGFNEPSSAGLTFNPEAMTEIEPPDMAEFMGFDFPADDPILGPFCANQIINLIGPTGLGKSNLTLHFLNAMSRGIGAMGWKSHKKVPVLYIDGEMGGTQLQDRFKHYNWTDADIRIVNAINWCAQNKLGQPNLSTEEWQRLILKWAPPGGVVALDNLMSLVHVPGVSLSSDEFWRVVTPLNLGLRAQGCTVLWVDHTNAEGKIFGTKTKEWQSDLVLTLMNNEKTEDFDEKPGTAFTLAFTKVRGERGPEHAALDVQMLPDRFAGFEWSHVTRKDSVLEIIRNFRAEGMSQRQIATEMGISLGKVNKLCKQAASALTYKAK